MKLRSRMLAAAVVGFLSSGAGAAVTLDFEGSSSSANPGSTAISIGNFYNGGTDSGGASGADYGISFTNANFDSTSQFTQPFNISSSIAYMTSSPLIFTSDFAFNSLSFDQFFFGPDTVLNVYAGANGTGALVATATYSQNCFPSCVSLNQTLSFASALSATFQPNANGTGIDNLTISAVPEPATWAMMLVGFGAIGFSMRRRQVKAVYLAAKA